MTRVGITTMTSTRLLTSLIGAALFLPWVTASTLQAQFECTAENTAGAYVYTKSGLQYETTSPGPFAPGPFGAIGLITFEPDGTVSKLIDFRMLSDGPSSFNGVNLGDVFDIRGTVEPDCRSTMTFADRASGTVIFEFVSVFANGGQEGWTIQISPADKLDITTFKRIDPIVDGKLRRRINKIAQRLGIFPLDDDD